MAAGIETRIKLLVARHLSLAEELITLDASIVQDLGADSLDQTELVMAIEEAFEIEISDEDVAHLRTVGDAVKLVQDRRSMQSARGGGAQTT